MKTSEYPDGNTRLTTKRSVKNVLVAITVLVIVVGSQYIYVSPFTAFGGAVWANDGLHYISDTKMSDRIEKINAPIEAKLANNVAQTTPSCEQTVGGFCQQSSGIYVTKTLSTPAVVHVPAVPDKKEIIGYCSLCRDGTFSPSCAVGRGACSWHGGVAAYNVARYRTIPGAPEIPAQPAVYSYDQKTYQDSPNYTKPETPSLSTIVNTAN